VWVQLRSLQANASGALGWHFSRLWASVSFPTLAPAFCPAITTEGVISTTTTTTTSHYTAIRRVAFSFNHSSQPWIASRSLPAGFTVRQPKARTPTRTSAASSSPSFSTSDSTTFLSTGPPLSARATVDLAKLTPIHRDQLRENALLKKYYCDVNIGDLIKFNEEIAHRLVTEPAEIIPLVWQTGGPIAPRHSDTCRCSSSWP
jgi:hypothetical protein